MARKTVTVGIVRATISLRGVAHPESFFLRDLENFPSCPQF
jgi:hypothetical protein